MLVEPTERRTNPLETTLSTVLLTRDTHTEPDLGVRPARPWTLSLTTTGTTPYVIAMENFTTRTAMEAELGRFRLTARQDLRQHNRSVDEYRVGAAYLRSLSDYRLTGIEHHDGTVLHRIPYRLLGLVDLRKHPRSSD
jgi:hypothetical protein